HRLVYRDPGRPQRPRCRVRGHGPDRPRRHVNHPHGRPAGPLGLVVPMPGSVMRLALLQFAPAAGELGPNLNRVLDGMRSAAAAGAGLLIAPEMCLTGWTLPDEGLRVRLAAETAHVAVPALSEAARRHAITVVTGGPLPAAGGVANCAVALTPA